MLEFPYRPYEAIAVATRKGVTIWHVGLNCDLGRRLSVEKVALLSGYEGEVSIQAFEISLFNINYNDSAFCIEREFLVLRFSRFD